MTGPRQATLREERAFDWLRALGTEQTPHSGRTLFQHLRGTWGLLYRYGEREAVCLAGLYHSIYGTNVFQHKTLHVDREEDREQVRAVIGSEAEVLVYLFCLARGRPKSILNGQIAGQWGWEGFAEENDTQTGQFVRDLRVIEIANLIEQGGLGEVARSL